MGSRSLFVAAVVCILALSTSGFAAVITYVEGADLPATGAPLPSFTLDIGVNTVSGTITTPGGVPPQDSDGFAFIVPVGMQVTAADLTIGDLEFNNVNAVKWTLFQGSDNSGTGTQVGIIGATPPSFPTTTTVPFQLAAVPVTLPLPANTYNLTQLASFPGAGSAGYTFSFTVAAVPEPTSLALFALAVPLIGRRSRRA